MWAQSLGGQAPAPRNAQISGAQQCNSGLCKPSGGLHRRRHSLRAERSQGHLACETSHNIAVLSGDGIGPEIMSVALDVLRSAGAAEAEEFVFNEALIGGAATDATGDPYPKETEAVCKASDAVLLAAIGG